MKNLHAFGWQRLAALIAPALTIILFPQTARTTGIESPLRWTEEAEQPQVLIAPEFFFEIEMKRLAAELKPAVKAIPPPRGEDGESSPDYDQQTTDADLADFAAALAAKAIQPPDAEKASTAHEEMRDLLGTVIHADTATDSLMAEDLIKPLKPAKEATEEPAAPDEFASEFADYHRAALSFRSGHREKAIEGWKALLARPDAERRYRTTWALFMLGKAAIEAENWDEALDWFTKTRAAAADGFIDTLGLAAASLGWQAFACEESERLPEAARLYLGQLASGDTTAIRSLRYLLEKAFGENADLEALVKDPVLQRVGTAAAVSEMSPFSSNFIGSEAADDHTTRWLAALEKAQAKTVRDADRVAWLFYSRGKFDKAARWLERADPSGPYVLWLKSKLAARAGKVDVAAKLLSQAMESLPPNDELVSRPLNSITEIPPRITASGDLGMLQLGRAEFLTAFRTFLDAGHFSDASYIADAVLTIDELKQFVDNELPAWEKARIVKKPVAFTNPDEPAEGDKPTPVETYDSMKIGWEEVSGGPGNGLREILARRYIRADRLAEARPYLSEYDQKAFDQYNAAIDRAKQAGASKAERSAALWEAAKVMQEHGESLADFHDPIAIANRLSGKKVETGPLPVIALKYTGPDKPIPAVTKGEKDRLRKNAVPSIRRYYSLYLATDLAWRAAALLPDNEEKTAVLLNTAGNWLRNADDDAADRFYQAMEKRCAKTEIGKEAIKHHWFVPVEEEPATEEKN